MVKRGNGFNLDSGGCGFSDSGRMDEHSISSLKRATLEGRVEALVHAQIESLQRKETREGKPFFEINRCESTT